MLVLLSCKSLSKMGLKEYPATPLSKRNFKSANGTYSEVPDTGNGQMSREPGTGFYGEKGLTLFDQLPSWIGPPKEAYRKPNGEDIPPAEKRVKIEFLTAHKARISLYYRDNLLLRKNIRGRFKKGYFYRRPNVCFIPFLPLIAVVHSTRTRIGISEGKLLMDHRVFSWGFALVAGSFTKGHVSSVYSRVGN